MNRIVSAGLTPQGFTQCSSVALGRDDLVRNFARQGQYSFAAQSRQSLPSVLHLLQQLSKP